MLENYFLGVAKTPEEVIELNQRLLAVQAALAVAIASVSASTSDSNNSKARWDLEHVAEHIESLADAIQGALEKE